MDNLLPCPFCESVQLAELSVANTQGQRRFIYCVSCSAQGPWSYKPRNASDMWNLRAAAQSAEATEPLDPTWQPGSTRPQGKPTEPATLEKGDDAACASNTRAAGVRLTPDPAVAGLPDEATRWSFVNQSGVFVREDDYKLLRAHTERLAEELKDAQYWRERHCRECIAANERSNLNWTRWKEAERELAELRKPGHVLVPVEPTEAMIDIASQWLCTYVHMRKNDRRNAISEAYKAMLVAANTRPDGDAVFGAGVREGKC